LAGLWPAPVFRRQRCGILTWSSACCASLPQHRDRAQDVGCHLLDRSRGCPPVGATWPDALIADQIAALAQRERAGCNPGMLLCEARELAAHNLDGWL